jgi:hypothetical protein
MFFVIKFFDRSVWVKRLSFVGNFDSLDFERFVVDTRYTWNLLVLTAVTAILGGLVYLAMSFLLKSHELRDILALVKKRGFGIPKKEEESITRTTEVS